MLLRAKHIIFSQIFCDSLSIVTVQASQSVRVTTKLSLVRRMFTCQLGPQGIVNLWKTIELTRFASQREVTHSFHLELKTSSLSIRPCPRLARASFHHGARRSVIVCWFIGVLCFEYLYWVGVQNDTSQLIESLS